MMKNILLIFVFSLFWTISFAQIKVKDFSRIESLFEIEPLIYKGRKIPNTYKLSAIPKGKAKPYWMEQKNYWGVWVKPELFKVREASSMAESIMANSGVILRYPAMEFKILEDSTILIVYKKWPKK